MKRLVFVGKNYGNKLSVRLFPVFGTSLPEAKAISSSLFSLFNVNVIVNCLNQPLYFG